MFVINALTVALLWLLTAKSLPKLHNSKSYQRLNEYRMRAVFFFFFFFFSDTVRIFCSMSEIFRAISDKASEKILLMAQQYPCDGSMLIN